MKITGAFDQALAGIQRGMAGMHKNAAEIASVGRQENDSPASMAQPLVELRQNAQQVAASATVIKAVDEALGTLLDELA